MLIAIILIKTVFKFFSAVKNMTIIKFYMTKFLKIQILIIFEYIKS